MFLFDDESDYIIEFYFWIIVLFNDTNNINRILNIALSVDNDMLE